MTPDEHAKLRALADAATPGPYRVVGNDVYCPDDETAPRGYSPVVYLAECMHDRNARYIAAACNAVPELLDEIERLRALLREAHGALAPFAEIGRVVTESPSSSDGDVLHSWVRHTGDAELTVLDCLRAAGLRRRIDETLNADAIRAAERDGE